jgi:hypothetical protein
MFNIILVFHVKFMSCDLQYENETGYHFLEVTCKFSYVITDIFIGDPAERRVLIHGICCLSVTSDI